MPHNPQKSGPPNLSRDPPTPSFRDPDSTSSIESRRSLAPNPEPEQAPAGVPDSQNAQRSERTRLEYHRIAHSFPDYGSVKGATKMPPSFKLPSFLKSAAPKTHVDTLDSNPGCLPSARQPSSARGPVGDPAPKRPKLHDHDPRPRGPDEEIADHEQDASSRAERRGSQSSFAHSTSPGISEFQVVEESIARTGRSNRRTRRPQGNRPHITTYQNGQAGTLTRRESIESFDVLAPAQKPLARDQRTARLLSTAGRRPTSLSDAADEYILANPTRPGQISQGLNKGKKRFSDEIANEHVGLEGDAKHGNTSLSVEDSPKRSRQGLSRRGDIKSAKPASRSGVKPLPTEIGVEGAVCQPNLRYMGESGGGSCFLRPSPGPELRAFDEEGNPVEDSLSWLKITLKARTLTYHPGSPLIKINQATDQTSATSIGGLMLLKFRNNAEASRVVDWARDHLKVELVQEKDRHKLLQIWDKKNQEISHASSQASARRLSDGSPTRPRREIEQRALTQPALPGSMSVSSRTPIRTQMQTSAQQQTPLPARSPDQLAISGSRSLRARQYARRTQEFDTPRSSVIRRWTEEHHDWAKDWKMPLVLERTTVDKEDIPRLDEGQCLNDNLIGYGLRYLFTKLNSKQEGLEKRVYLHNSFFYEKLKAGRGAINYDGVKNWTAKVDLLSFDYIIVPVNEHYHWWVAIICNPGRLDPDWRGSSGKTEGPSNGVQGKGDEASSDVEMTDVVQKQPLLQSPKTPTADNSALVKAEIVDLISDDKNASIDLTTGSRARQTKTLRPGARTYSPEDPRIITLDSMGSSHPQAITLLKKYLLAEFEHKRNKVIPEPSQPLGMKATNIPEQNNLCDCGVYLLGYIQEFVQTPDQFIQTLLERKKPNWNFSPSDLRDLWRDTIKLEQSMYQKQQLEAKEQRRDITPAKRTPNGSAQPDRGPSRETSEVSNSESAAERATSEHSAHKTMTPAGDHSTGESAPAGPPAASTEEPQPPAPANPDKPPQDAPGPKSPNQDVVLLPPRQEDRILPSIEATEVEEIPAPSRQSPDEPKFIRPLPSSSDSGVNDGDDEDNFAEVGPETFYASNPKSRSGSNGKKRTALSSPAGGQRKRMANTRPVAHTSSHFVVDCSPSLEPVVEKAEVVRHSDPIDLT